MGFLALGTIVLVGTLGAVWMMVLWGLGWLYKLIYYGVQSFELGVKQVFLGYTG